MKFDESWSLAKFITMQSGKRAYCSRCNDAHKIWARQIHNHAMQLTELQTVCFNCNTVLVSRAVPLRESNG